MRVDMATEHLQFELREGIGWCTVSRPEARNLMTPAMYAGIGTAVRHCESQGVPALILTGTDPYFIPGGDMAPEGDAYAGSPPSSYLPFRTVLHSSVPIVAAINGGCQASGLIFAMLADVAVASEQSWFRAPELHRGVPDPWLAATLPAHIGLGRARALALTGRKLNAAQAYDIGLVSAVVPHSDLLATAYDAAVNVLESAPGARIAWRGVADRAYGAIDDALLDSVVDDPEAAEGMASFLQRRPPTWSIRPAFGR